MNSMDVNNPPKNSRIQLSRSTLALLHEVSKIKPKLSPEEFAQINVSQTASFMAIAYEKVRNVVEYRDTNVIRRGAIGRILKRRLLLNPKGKGEGENLVRELLWARYFDQDSLGTADVERVQKIIDKYIAFRSSKQSHNEFLFHLLTCEIEEALSPAQARRKSLETFFIFQVLKDKVRIEGLGDDKKDAYFYIALERYFNKSDIAYMRYNLFKLHGKELVEFGPDEMAEFDKIDNLINNNYMERLRGFVKANIPPFKILFTMLRGEHNAPWEQILSHRESLWNYVSATCDTKYEQNSQRLRMLGVKAIIYILLTKMVLALVLEYPVSLYLFGEVHYLSLIINAIFPPFVMFVVIGLTSMPGPDNTKRIYERILHILDKDRTFEGDVSLLLKARKTRRTTLSLVFGLFYVFTFAVTFILLHMVLKVLNFNIISELVFVFFVSLVIFFSYRVRLVAKEYKLKEHETLLRPITDFFTIPFLTIGKFLSRSFARFNFLTVFLDLIVEAPFKLLVEVVEEWIKFVRARKDEIV